MGCKVPTDPVKISVKKAMPMGFYYMNSEQATHILKSLESKWDACPDFSFSKENWLCYNGMALKMVKNHTDTQFTHHEAK